MKNKLFCFPCLLFSISSQSVWVNDGYSDLNNLAKAIIKHEQSSLHYKNQISLKTFGLNRIDLLLDKQKLINIENHNQHVKNNRKILKKLIYACCFLIKQELAICGNDERKLSFNRWNNIEFLNYTSLFDDMLSQHLHNSTVFSGISNFI